VDDARPATAAVEFALLRSRPGETLAGPAYYRALARHGLAYGPAFQAVEEIIRHGSEVLARLRLPAAATPVGTRRLHPALLDAALHAALATVLGPDWGERHHDAFLSTGVGRLAVRAAAAGEVWAYATLRAVSADGRRHELDVTLADPSGTVLAEATGLTVVRLPGQAPPAGDAPADETVRDRLLAMPGAAERGAALESVLRECVSQVVKLPAARVELDAPLRGLGVDSIMSVELCNRLTARLGVRLSATLVWNYPTIRELVPFLATKLGVPLTEAPETIDRSLAPTPLPVAGAADDLERELAELLHRMEAL
jgi:phthiocerol/phenolphthiocerol synthesis type-I polyketide synthase A